MDIKEIIIERPSNKQTNYLQYITVCTVVPYPIDAKVDFYEKISFFFQPFHRKSKRIS